MNVKEWKVQAGTQHPDEPGHLCEGTLRRCAEKADESVGPYMEEDYEQAIVDLLSDLMHLTDREGEDFESLLETARGHYRAEIDGEL